MSDRRLWVSLGLGAVLALLACYGVATQSLILGAPEGGWYYGYVEHVSVRPFGAVLLVVGTASALLLVLRPGPGQREWLVVLAWVVAATGLQGLLRSLTPFTLEEIFLSDGANSFYSVTQQFDARTVLDEFRDVRAKSPLHAQSNMPGKLMLLYGLQTISPRTDVLPWFVLMVSNLGALLMYLFVRDLFNDRRVALYSAVLYLFVPARLLFFPLLNTVTPVVCLCCGCVLVRWLQTGKTKYAAILGVALYGLVFFEPLPLVMGLLFAVLMARALSRKEMSGRQLLAQMTIGVVAFGVTFLAMYLWFGFELIDAFRQVGAHAVEFNALSERPYAVWVWQNLREFAFGVGLCQAVVFWAALVDGLGAPGNWRDRLTKPVAVVCLGLLAVLIATDLIGLNRGEVIRLWIFLASFFQIPAAYVCARLPGHAALVLVLAMSVLQAALGTAMIGFVVLA